MGNSLIRSFLLPSLLLFFSSTTIIQIPKIKTLSSCSIEFSGHRKKKKRNCFHCLTWTTYPPDYIPVDREIMIHIQRASLELKSQ